MEKIFIKDGKLLNVVVESKQKIRHSLFMTGSFDIKMTTLPKQPVDSVGILCNLYANNNPIFSPQK